MGKDIHRRRSRSSGEGQEGRKSVEWYKRVFQDSGGKVTGRMEEGREGLHRGSLAERTA